MTLTDKAKGIRLILAAVVLFWVAMVGAYLLGYAIGAGR